MIEKVKLTQEQADAIKTWLLGRGGDEAKTELLNVHAKNNTNNCDCYNVWGGVYKSLNHLDSSDMARALLIGYEVEETFKVGDWVRYWRTDCSAIIGKIEVIAEKERLFKADNCPDERQISDITRHATLKEIKAEQEHRAWESIGREVGQFVPGDIGVSHNGETFKAQYNLKNLYEKGELKGIYPAGPFISFGGESHDN